MRYMITGDLWQTLERVVTHAKRYTCGQPPILLEQMIFEALLYWTQTGVPWRDLPAVFGPGTQSITGTAGGSPPGAWPGCSNSSPRLRTARAAGVVSIAPLAPIRLQTRRSAVSELAQ
jgi:transposase